MYQSDTDSGLVASPINDRDTWLAARRADVTSTEVAALFGLSPYTTEFELWHKKSANSADDFTASERMRWGTRLESAIAYGVAEDRGWAVAPLAVYMRRPAERIGSSFDYEVVSGPEAGAILEIKNVDGRFGGQWAEGEAPAHIEMQVQHQMLVAGRKKCWIGALVGGNTQVVLERAADPDVAALISSRVEEFWAQVAAGTPPRPDFARDADYIVRRLRGYADQAKAIEASPRVEALLESYLELGAQAAAVQGLRDAAKAAILMEIGDAARVTASFGSLSAAMTRAWPATVVTQEMVGTSIGGRSGYRNFRFTKRR